MYLKERNGCFKLCDFPHLQVHTFRGPHWCEYCANFMWGLIAQGVKCAGNSQKKNKTVTQIVFL